MIDDTVLRCTIQSSDQLHLYRVYGSPKEERHCPLKQRKKTTMLQELTMEEIEAVSGGLPPAEVAGALLGGAAVLTGGIAVGFGVAGAVGVIGVDAALGGSLGFGLISGGFGAASLLTALYKEV